MPSSDPCRSVPPCIVLDTNVCLDLWVFFDPACAALLRDLQDGRVHAVTRADCRAEWLAVLHYPQLPIDEAMRPGLVAAYDNLLHRLPQGPLAADATGLPRCRDPDDQKFLELAAQAGARWLLSKDKALLRLDGKLRRAGRFRVLHPQSWARER